MKKNVASQVIGAQMITAADGSNFTGSVTVYVTGDGGTQAVGSVSSGACTHEGKGFHTYAPAQAETNYDHVAFTFEGTGAITATVQIYTSFPQTGDNFARIGAPVGASISADIAGVQSDTNDIQTRLPAALVSGRIDASVGAMAANVLTASALATDAVDEITAEVWAEATRTLTGIDEDTTTLDLDATIRSAVGLASANLDTQLDALPTAAENATAVWAAGTRSLTIIDEDSTTLDLDATIRAAVGLASANLDTQLAAIDDAVDTEVAAVKATTDKLDTMLEATSDGYHFSANAIDEIPDAVWREPIANHSGVTGSTSEALNAAGAAGDPWTTALPGAYGAGSAGFIVGTNLDAAVSTRASQASVDTIDDFVDIEVAAIKAVTDKLDGMLQATSDAYQFTADALEEAPSGGGSLTAADVWAHGTRTLTAIDEDSTTLDLDATIRAAVGLASANLDTQLDALPTAAENATAIWAAGTRSLTVLDEDSTTLDLDATIRAAVGLASADLDTQLGAVPTAAENADTLLNRDMSTGSDSGSDTVRTPRQALRILRNKWTIDSDGLQTITKEDDTTASWTQQLSTDASATPVVGADPSGP